MPLHKQPYKGTRDFYPEEKRYQKWIFSKWREVAEKFGYEEYDGPILEPTDLFLAKGNEEIIAEQTYTFSDRGNRSLTVRTEITPTLCRMVAAKRNEFNYPLRLYSIPNLMRYERSQRGRLREFWQLNIDLFGIADISAEMEIISLSDEILQAIGAKRSMYTIKINSRKFMDYVLQDYLGLDEIEVQTARRLIDKKSKISLAEFIASMEAILRPSDRVAGKLDKIIEVLDAKSVDELPEELKNHKALDNLQSLIAYLHDEGIANAEIDLNIMRGFDYYTDIVFEVFDNDPNNNRAMFGGGRYDNLIEIFGVEPLPAIGFGVGDVAFMNFLDSHNLSPKLVSETELYVITTSDIDYRSVSSILGALREEGVRIFYDMSEKKMDKKLKYAVKKGIPYVLFIGQEELESEKFTLKNITSHKEQKLSLSRIISTVKDYRNSD